MEVTTVDDALYAYQSEGPMYIADQSLPPGQQPTLLFVPQLSARPWWAPDLICRLTQARGTILTESRQLMATIDPHHIRGRSVTGNWSAYYLLNAGTWHHENCARCPRTTELLRALPICESALGSVYVSVLGPGMHASAQQGLSNATLRAHVVLEAASGGRMRLDEGTQGWEDGDGMLFDDSYTHAMWNGEAGETILLVIDMWHPELSPSDTEKIRAAFPSEPLPERVELMQAVLCNPSLALEIAARLDVQSIGLASRSCVAWADTVRDQDLWEWLCVRARVPHGPELGWKDSFKDAHLNRFTECDEYEEGRLKYDVMCKVLFTGSSGSGKTSFHCRLMEDHWFRPEIDFHARIGVDFKLRTVRCASTSVKLQVWDPQLYGTRFRPLISGAYYRSAHIVLVMYDSTDRSSFDDSAQYLQEIEKHVRDCRVGLVASKCDLIDERQVSYEEGAALAASWANRFPDGVHFAETSSKTGEGVEAVTALHVRGCLKAGYYSPKPSQIEPTPPSRCCVS